MSTKEKQDMGFTLTRSGKKMYFGKSPAIDVKVSEQIIKESVERHSGHCMVAEAIQARYPRAKFVAVDIQTIRFSDPDKKERYTYLTPRSAQVAIIKFDQGIKPEPFEFRLRGAQITTFGRSLEDRKKERERTARLNLTKKNREKRAFLRKIQGKDSIIPEKVGGLTPPASSHRHPPVAGGVRRAFGLRALEM